MSEAATTPSDVVPSVATEFLNAKSQHETQHEINMKHYTSTKHETQIIEHDNDIEITISMFDSVKDNQPKQSTRRWSEFSKS